MTHIKSYQNHHIDHLFTFFFLLLADIVRLLNNPQCYKGALLCLVNLTDGAPAEFLLQILQNNDVIAAIFEPTKSTPLTGFEVIFVVNIALHEDAKQYVITLGLNLICGS